MLKGLAPGDQLPHRAVHARFGGRQQGGIVPARVAPGRDVFTDPNTGQRHGYYDEWDAEGLYN